MATRLFLVYVLVELAVTIVLLSTIGFGWTILVLLATFVLGVALAGSQLKRHLLRLREGLRSPGPQSQLGAAADGLLVALGAVLVFIPGLASSVLGALLLMPPTRAVARPLFAAVMTRSLGRGVPLIVTTAGYAGAAGSAGRRYATRGDYIDGEVIDGPIFDGPQTPGPDSDRDDHRPRSLPPRGSSAAD